MDATADDAALARVREAVAAAVDRLSASGARDEALAVYVPRHRRLLIPREPTLRPAGRVWRLGVVLLSREGMLHATGSLVRATPPGRAQYQSVSAETRRAYRAAAERGHFEPGETVDFDAQPIALDADSLRESRGPLFLRDGRVLVRWSTAVADADARDFVDYLDERVELLAHPPEGA